MFDNVQRQQQQKQTHPPQMSHLMGMAPQQQPLQLQKPTPSPQLMHPTSHAMPHQMSHPQHQMSPVLHPQEEKRDDRDQAKEKEIERKRDQERKRRAAVSNYYCYAERRLSKVKSSFLC